VTTKGALNQMSREGFWGSAEGAEYRALWRELTTARGGVSVKPKAKGSGGASRERALIVAASSRSLVCIGITPRTPGDRCLRQRSAPGCPVEHHIERSLP
jgi:hypothetical protein